MRTELYPIAGPWPGRLAIMPRPRVGDWLEEEVRAWRNAGMNIVVSLLTREEQSELGIESEEALCRANGIEFVSFAITDRGVPGSMQAFMNLIGKLTEALEEGKSIAVHCRQGIGRAAMVAIGILAQRGIEPGEAMKQVGAARGCAVPETAEQKRWISEFAKSLIAPIQR